MGHSFRNIAQKEAIRRLLERAGGDWVPLPDIMGAMGPGTLIASHTRRIFELRDEFRRVGIEIECKSETVLGQRRTKYRLVIPVGQLDLI